MTNDVTDRLVGTSPAIGELAAQIDCAARSDAKVLITGESGVGKEVVARLVHKKSARRPGPFVALNCAGVPETLLEPELFGHSRGSFTGAYRDRPGRLEAAHRGSFLLDEIGEMSLRMQGLLLRFLETGEVQRIGSTGGNKTVDARIIAATNVNLGRAVSEKAFRADLYYRLNVIHIEVSPLRERREDVPELLGFFLTACAEYYGTDEPRLSPEALERLLAYDWPGNVRELRNVAERLAVRAPGRDVGPNELPPEVSEPREKSAPEAPQSSADDRLFDRMVKGRESFWSVVYDPFMLRDLTRQDVRRVVEKGLRQTRGSHSMLLELFNMSPGDHARLAAFLRKHHCHLPRRRHPAPPPVAGGAEPGSPPAAGSGPV